MNYDNQSQPQQKRVPQHGKGPAIQSGMEDTGMMGNQNMPHETPMHKHIRNADIGKGGER